VPLDIGRTPSGTATTQAALGRVLLDLTRQAPEVAGRVVTVSPDVSSSTNLGGWVNKVGVWSVAERRDWFADDTETILHWREAPTGQHIDLGIAEGNLVGLLGELGATWSRWGEPLLPIGVVYDPFVERALEPWSFGIYAGGQSILVGTPSGVSLAPEGGAHQSIKTPSIGLEQPGCTTYEPAFAIDTEWTLLASMARLGQPDGCSAYRASAKSGDWASDLGVCWTLTRCGVCDWRGPWDLDGGVKATPNQGPHRQCHPRALPPSARNPSVRRPRRCCWSCWRRCRTPGADEGSDTACPGSSRSGSRRSSPALDRSRRSGSGLPTQTLISLQHWGCVVGVDPRSRRFVERSPGSTRPSSTPSSRPGCGPARWWSTNGG
jgi:hypothetical protein